MRGERQPVATLSCLVQSANAPMDAPWLSGKDIRPENSFVSLLSHHFHRVGNRDVD